MKRTMVSAPATAVEVRRMTVLPMSLAGAVLEFRPFGCYVFGGIAVLSAAIANGQGSAPPAPADRPPVRITMTECEAGQCKRGQAGTWSFSGRTGTARWPYGANATLLIERNDASGIVIRRTDTSSSSSRGLVAIYEGHITDNRVEGKVTWQFPGRSASGGWYATIDQPVQTRQSPRSGGNAGSGGLPSILHFCDVNCVTLKLDQGRFVGLRSGQEPDDWSEVWTVESFAHDSVVLQRTLSGRIHFTVTYRGQMSADGNQLINAANPFKGPGQPVNIQLAWGDALASVPGNNAARDGGGGTQLSQQQVSEGVLLVSILASLFGGDTDSEHARTCQAWHASNAGGGVWQTVPCR